MDVLWGHDVPSVAPADPKAPWIAWEQDPQRRSALASRWMHEEVHNATIVIRLVLRDVLDPRPRVLLVNNGSFGDDARTPDLHPPRADCEIGKL